MGGENFAFNIEHVPGHVVAIGVRNEEQGTVFSLHRPKLKVDDDALPLGTAMHVAFALKPLIELREHA